MERAGQPATHACTEVLPTRTALVQAALGYVPAVQCQQGASAASPASPTTNDFPRRGDTVAVAAEHGAMGAPRPPRLPHSLPLPSHFLRQARRPGLQGRPLVPAAGWTGRATSTTPHRPAIAPAAPRVLPAPPSLCVLTPVRPARRLRPTATPRDAPSQPLFITPLSERFRGAGTAGTPRYCPRSTTSHAFRPASFLLQSASAPVRQRSVAQPRAQRAASGCEGRGRARTATDRTTCTFACKQRNRVYKLGGQPKEGMRVARGGYRYTFHSWLIVARGEVRASLR